MYGEEIEYNELGEGSDSELKREYWETAVGLQQVDGLRPSPYLYELIEENISGQSSYPEVEAKLASYYAGRNLNEPEIHGEHEADIVSARIARLLEDRSFVLAVPTLKGIHEQLFTGLFDHAGRFRTVNIEKREQVLHGLSVEYGDARTLESTLQYVIDDEKSKPYSLPFDQQGVARIAQFMSALWEVHPFREGNTRTTAVFVEKYLHKLGFAVNNEPFKQHSDYLRNALVRANYANYPQGIAGNPSYLISFFENLLLGTEHTLDNRTLFTEG
jgi:fido (protein-threonine AMPylation protein)